MSNKIIINKMTNQKIQIRTTLRMKKKIKNKQI